MIYLILATLCSASIALIFKYSETAGMNRYAVTSANYLTASAVGAVMIAGADLPYAPGIEWGKGFGEITEAIAGSGVMLSPQASLIWAVLIGLAAGVVFFLAFIYYQLSVRDYGVGLSGSFAKLGILVPLSLSLVLWKELPTGLQWAGIILAVSSIALVNWPVKRDIRKALRPALILLFLFGGTAEFSNKLFQKYAISDYKSVFLFVTFTVALVFSLATTWRKRLPIRRRDIITGVAVGVPNLFSSFFLILALNSIPAAVAFPAYGAGSILIISIVGVTVFREHLTNREWVAVSLTAIALILMNV